MEPYLPYIIAAIITLFFLARYLRQLKKRAKRARAAAEKGQLFSDGPKGLHPHIDTSNCIGCGGCTQVFPEGDVLAMLGGQAAIVNGHKCIGHGLCAEPSPVRPLPLGIASPTTAPDLPSPTPAPQTLH